VAVIQPLVDMPWAADTLLAAVDMPWAADTLLAAVDMLLLLAVDIRAVAASIARSTGNEVSTSGEARQLRRFLVNSGRRGFDIALWE
jgi:hypothetical protein